MGSREKKLQDQFFFLPKSKTGILVLHKRVKGIVMEEICYMGPKRIVAHVVHAHMTTSGIHL